MSLLEQLQQLLEQPRRPARPRPRGPVTVISLPRTRISDDEGGFDQLEEGVLLAQEGHHRLVPGTRILTCVVAAATCRALGGCPRSSCCRRTGPLGSRGRQPISFLARLPGWPRHRPPTEQVEVQMEHALPGVGPHVRHQTPSRLGRSPRRRASCVAACATSASMSPWPSLDAPRSTRCAPWGSSGCAWAPAG